MRGKKTSEEDKEKLKAVIYMNPTASQRDIARQVDMPLTTVHQLYDEVKNTDEFEQARTIKKQEFIDKAWELVGKTMLKMNEKLDTMTTDELKKVNIRDLAVAMGTTYDKQALANGEPTQISESRKPIAELAKEFQAKAAELDRLVSGE